MEENRSLRNQTVIIPPLSPPRSPVIEPIHRTNRINLLYIRQLTFISNIVAFIHENIQGISRLLPIPTFSPAFTFKVIFYIGRNNVAKLEVLEPIIRMKVCYCLVENYYCGCKRNTMLFKMGIRYLCAQTLNIYYYICFYI